MCQPEIISDAQFRAASEALVEYIEEEDVQIGSCVREKANLFQSSPN